MSKQDLTVKDANLKPPTTFSWGLRTKNHRVNFVVVNRNIETGERLTLAEIDKLESEMILQTRFRTIQQMIYEFMQEYYNDYQIFISYEK